MPPGATSAGRNDIRPDERAERDMPQQRPKDILASIALAGLWLALMVAGFAAINHRADNLLALYVVAAATGLTLFIRWIWQRRSP